MTNPNEGRSANSTICYYKERKAKQQTLNQIFQSCSFTIALTSRADDTIILVIIQRPTVYFAFTK